MMKRYAVCLPICLLFLLWTNRAWAQQNQQLIYGILQTESGTPVAGASISLVEHPSYRVVSNASGTFSIRGQMGEHLKIKNNNIHPEKVTIRGDTMRITIEGPAKIPIGYGRTRTARNLTGAVSMTGAKTFDELGLLNPANALYGKLLGLTVLENSGTVPTSPTLLIRGRGTFTNSSPLVLVDGFQRPMTRLAPEAIKKVTVLKDAAALAIYGQRGANGVILVTTKRGSAHPLEVHASFDRSITRPTGLPEFLGAANYALALNEALINDGLRPRYSPKEVYLFKSGSKPYLYPSVNWMNQVLRSHGTRTDFNVTFSGGGEVARYFALIRYSHSSGIFGPVNRNEAYSTQSKHGRLNFRTNLDIDLTEDLLLKLNAAVMIDDNNIPQRGGGPGRIMNAVYTIPSSAFPVKTADGNWGGTPIYSNNPMALLTSTGHGYPNNRVLQLDAHLIQDFDKITKGLSGELAVSYTNYASYFENKTKNYRYESISPVWRNGIIADTKAIIYGQNTPLKYHQSFGNQVRSTNIVAKVKYNRSFGNDELTAMVLFHQNGRVTQGKNHEAHRRNFAANVLYNLNGKYIFGATASYSGNNRLPKGEYYNFFPAVSAAWLLSAEDFLNNSSFVDFLKLRASWGIVGSADYLPINDPFIHNFIAKRGPRNPNGYPFGPSNRHEWGFTEQNLPVIDFTVETSHKTNIGIDARLFGGLSLTANVFYAHRTNILTGSVGLYSGVLGIAPPRITNGVVDNKGFEASLKWQDTIGDVTWHIGGQFSVTHNEIVNINEKYRPYDYLKRTGREVGQLFGLQVIGFFKDQHDIATSPKQVFSNVQPGDIKYKDQNGDDIINKFDEVPLGYHTGYPNIYFSAFFGIHYKGFGVSALFQGTGQYTAYMNTPSVYWPLRNNKTISKYYYTHRWTPETAETATLPRLTTTDNDNNFRHNSLWYMDRSYIKLRTLKISYSLPVSLVEKLNMDVIRVVVEGRNLFSIDNIPVGNPDKNSTANYPIMRTYSLGLQVAF